MAVTQNVLDCPEQIVALTGCVVIVIAVFTVSVATVEFVVPQTVVAWQRY